MVLGKSLSRSVSREANLPHLLCGPCARRLCNIQSFQSTIQQAQTVFESRYKTVIEMSPSAPSAIGSEELAARFQILPPFEKDWVLAMARVSRSGRRGTFHFFRLCLEAYCTTIVKFCAQECKTDI